MKESENSDLRIFFEELKNFYEKSHQEFVWTWDQIEKKDRVWNNKKNLTQEFIYYIAYNLSKNVIHGPLPNHLHTRMIFGPNNDWSKKYVEYLEGK